MTQAVLLGIRQVTIGQVLADYTSFNLLDHRTSRGHKQQADQTPRVSCKKSPPKEFIDVSSARTYASSQ